MNWSFSRERMLKDCEKKYFYHYIVPSYTAKQIDENILKNVLFLRKLTNRHLLLGKVIHHTISESVHNFYKNHLVPLSEMMDKCWERFIRARQFSQDQKYLFQTATHPDFTILFEDFYGIDLHDHWLTQHYQKMKTALRHFYKWFVTDTNQRWSDFELIENEQLKSFLERDVQVWTVIDLLLKSPQNVWYIIDWKLSTFDWEKDSLQLAFYGWYVHQTYAKSCSLKMINFYLNTGYDHRFLWDEQLEELTKSYFENSVRYLQAFHEKLNEKYPFRNLQTAKKKQLCWQCNFRKICLSRKGEEQKLNNLEHKNYYQRKEDVPSNWRN